MLILVIATVIVVLSLVSLNVKYSQEQSLIKEEEAYYDLSATKVTAENIEGVLSFQYNKAMEETSNNHPAIQSQRQ
jgi:ABC-type phosphate/phosphonate transport system ATPase subunit